jgi:uncharacterized protein
MPNQYYRALMSEGTPEKIVPRYIEPRKFCIHGVVLSGSVTGSNMPRLDAASASVKNLNAELEFSCDQEHRRVVTGNLRGQLVLECQRCLADMPFNVEVEINWAVVWDEEKAKQLPARLEPWIAGEEAEDLYYMIEEELLLALPTAPVHPQLCIESSLFESSRLSAGEEPIVVAEESPKDSIQAPNNPFQVLKVLKNGPNSNE